MRTYLPLNVFQRTFVLAFLLISFIGNAQDIQVKILGSTTTVSNGGAVSFSAGNTISFRITNTRGDCDKVKIEDIIVSNTTDFSISSDKIPTNVDTEGCKGKTKYVDFTITNKSGYCGASTDIAIEVKQNPDFEFEFSISGNPAINVLGGSPLADINHNSTTTTATNGTYFGVIEAGISVTRNFIIANTGSCPLDITNISTSPTDTIPIPRYDFTVPSYVLLSDGVTQSSFTATVPSGAYVILPVTFTGPVGGSGTLESTISVTNSANSSYTFKVSAEMFDYEIPGPGGITADFRLWLKSTRGITIGGSDNVMSWSDIGTNPKDAEAISGKEPTYLDTPEDNINFNPVVKFVNNGSTEQYMYNDNSNLSGFYSADIFIVMIPEEIMSSSSDRNTIFGGVDSDAVGDVTGIGFGDYSSGFNNETLSYNQDIPGTSTFNGAAETSSTYSKAGIINVRNNTEVSPTHQEILYNSNPLITLSEQNSFANLDGNKYWIGKNRDGVASLNGRVAEIFTFSSRLDDLTERPKIESYLAIKYGITLGTTTEAEKDYINSLDTIVWDVSENTGFNHHVAGIGRDDDSDLYQKQSKTIND